MKTQLPNWARCELVAWDDRHDGATVQWLNEVFIRASFGITSAVTLQSHTAWRANHPSIVACAIEFDGHHCGNLLLDVNKAHQSAYLQIYIGSAAVRGQGVGRIAMSKALNHGFGALGLERIWLHTRTDNLIAERLYRNLGFQTEGLERQAIATPQGRVDQRRWSLLALEWVNLEKRQ